ncbi:Centrosome-associated protein like [Actinidia chinensis var. chinensis]|uniref:Centrosome-associated protein like n=1 Tax=Actinidia chinensis var. chinensis TaxID=1590841 RepID=A0A2R6QHS6_ACTCC|nr:Centrosome-associated protein like [Actinidia chinensis var. chinensis]
MSTPQKRKGSQTLAFRRDSDSPSKWSRTRFGVPGTSSSQQRADAFSPEVTKFRPNSEAEMCFNRLLFMFGIHLIVPVPHESRLPTGKPISRTALCLSNAHLGVCLPLPHPKPHAVDLDPPEDKVHAPAATDLPSTSTAPPPTVASLHIAIDSRITDAIASLFDTWKIHKDLIERIGQVHERVDQCWTWLLWSARLMISRLSVTRYQLYPSVTLSSSSKLMSSYRAFIVGDMIWLFGVELVSFLLGPFFLVLLTDSWCVLLVTFLVLADTHWLLYIFVCFLMVDALSYFYLHSLLLP